MRRAYQLAGVAFLAIAAFLGYYASALRYYTPLGPGPGFFPVWLCALLAVLAVVVVVQATFAAPQPLPDDFSPARAGWLRIGVVLAGLMGVAILLPVAGFRLTMLPFFLLVLSTLARRNPLETLLLAFIGSFGIHHLFVQVLNQPLPAGRLGF